MRPSPGDDFGEDAPPSIVLTRDASAGRPAPTMTDRQRPFLAVRRLGTRLGTCLALVAASCSSTDEAREHESDVSYLVTRERYEDAVRVAHERWQRKDDATTREEYRLASVAYLLDRARAQSLANEDDAALETLAQAHAIAPDSPEVLEWELKTRDKLATRWFNRARDRHTDDDLPGALAGYEAVLSYVPDHPEALSGIQRVVEQLEYRDGLSKGYYNEGLGALRDWELRLAENRFTYARKYRHWDEKPGRRLAQVQEELAVEMGQAALEDEVNGYYAAAQLQYRLARLLDPENEVAAAGLARMQVEVEADELLDKGEMWILRGEYAKAEEVLGQGRALTAVQHERFDEALAGIEDARNATLYEEGLNFERDFLYPEAAASYRNLLGRVDFYQDARARLTSLEATMAEVEELYASLGDLADDPAREREVLARIDALWPEYRDIEQRLAALGPPDGDGK